jgi:hypothetical protein
LSLSGFDVLGVREQGLVTGYVRASDLDRGILADHLLEFSEEVLVAGNTSLSLVFDKLNDSLFLFVSAFGEVGGIVTRADMQKAPVRMWLFGLISLLEMQMLRIVRQIYPGDTWLDQLSDGRIAKAKEIFDDRRGRNEEIDLAECLQFADKRDLLLQPHIISAFGFDSKAGMRATFVRLEQVRNELAHSQDFIAGDWPSMSDLVKQGVELLDTAEAIETG